MFSGKGAFWTSSPKERSKIGVHVHPFQDAETPSEKAPIQLSFLLDSKRGDRKDWPVILRTEHVNGRGARSLRQLSKR